MEQDIKFRKERLKKWKDLISEVFGGPGSGPNPGGGKGDDGDDVESKISKDSKKPLEDKMKTWDDRTLSETITEGTQRAKALINDDKENGTNKHEAEIDKQQKIVATAKKVRSEKSSGPRDTSMTGGTAGEKGDGKFNPLIEHSPYMITGSNNLIHNLTNTRSKEYESVSEPPDKYGTKYTHLYDGGDHFASIIDMGSIKEIRHDGTLATGGYRIGKKKFKG